MIFLGPPGAGKGTQAKRIEESYALVLLSVSNILRSAVELGSETGKRIQSLMDNGNLVPDEIVTSIIEERFQSDDLGRGFILDGFPRTVAQAEAFDEILIGRDEKLDVVLELKVDDDFLIERITGRYVCVDCGKGYHGTFEKPITEGVCNQCGSTRLQRRTDDTVEIVRRRLDAYYAQTALVLPYYAQKGLLRTVDGAAGIEEVARQIDEVLNGMA